MCGTLINDTTKYGSVQSLPATNSIARRIMIFLHKASTRWKTQRNRSKGLASHCHFLNFLFP